LARPPASDQAPEQAFDQSDTPIQDQTHGAARPVDRGGIDRTRSERARSGQARRDKSRKLADAARVIPVLAGVLMMIPLLWPRGGADTVATSFAGIYLFLIWGGSIAAAAVLARALTRLDDPSALQPLGAKAASTQGEAGDGDV